MSCWPTCTHQQTRVASWKSQQSRLSVGTTCCACTMRSRKHSTSLGTSVPAPYPRLYPHLLMTRGSKTPVDTGLEGSLSPVVPIQAPPLCSSVLSGDRSQLNETTHRPENLSCLKPLGEPWPPKANLSHIVGGKHPKSPQPRGQLPQRSFS